MARHRLVHCFLLDGGSDASTSSSSNDNATNDERLRRGGFEADRLNVNELARIDAEIGALKCKLGELELSYDELDRLVERAKGQRINPNVEVDNTLTLTCANVFNFVNA